MKLFTLGIASLLILACSISANAQSWTSLNNQLALTGEGAVLQLRDGRILVHHEDQNGAYTDWWVLTPDAYGSYVNGTWSSGGNLPTGYAPTYFGSQVLLNATTLNCPLIQCGQVVIEGGEYNGTTETDTNLGAIATYEPFGAISWVANAPPSGWTRIGDAASITLPNGSYMQSSCCDSQNPAGHQIAIYQGPNSWISSGNVKESTTDESGFTLLTNGLVLMTDTKSTTACPAATRSSELYTITNETTGVGTWACGPSLPVQLYNSKDEEMGATVMMYNNRVFQFGGSVNATAIYDVALNSWTAGPTPVAGLDQSDGPAAVEPNGKVLAMLSPGLFLNGCYMVEYDPSTNTLTDTTDTVIPQPLDCSPPSTDTSYSGHLMILPTGQILFTAFVPTIQVYTPEPGVATWTCSSCSPAQSTPIPATILLSSTILRSGSINNLVYGYQLNGLSQNNFYGDDNQYDTNFPLARITCANVAGNSCTPGYVYYAFTHDDGPAGSTVHSIAPKHFGYTHFDLPVVPAGMYDFQTVTNGIPSTAIRVNVTSAISGS